MQGFCWDFVCFFEYYYPKDKPRLLHYIEAISDQFQHSKITKYVELLRDIQVIHVLLTVLISILDIFSLFIRVIHPGSF